MASRALVIGLDCAPPQPLFGRRRDGLRAVPTAPAALGRAMPVETEGLSVF